VIKRFRQFARSADFLPECLRLFTLIALNCALRNGDAHLKNFGILYDEVAGDAHLAPVYDLVTTAVYLPRDRMALTLNGSTEWPSAKRLLEFGERGLLGSRRALKEQMQKIEDALANTAKDVMAYAAEHPAFVEIGTQMVAAWQTGARESLRFA
jgi:serine/threonine-protein kinase HipA